jgi:predicted negative regulator of RcsB-dependent stress response
VKTRTLVIVVLLAGLFGAFGWYRWAERHFNAHADKVRIIVLLSPT